jgi:hypothetical protein
MAVARSDKRRSELPAVWEVRTRLQKRRSRVLNAPEMAAQSGTGGPVGAQRCAAQAT